MHMQLKAASLTAVTTIAVLGGFVVSTAPAGLGGAPHSGALVAKIPSRRRAT